MVVWEKEVDASDEVGLMRSSSAIKEHTKNPTKKAHRRNKEIHTNPVENEICELNLQLMAENKKVLQLTTEKKSKLAKPLTTMEGA